MPPVLRSSGTRARRSASPPVAKAKVKAKAKAKTSRAATMKPQETQYWLMKAEPESRIVKGKDVKFSIDDLQAMENSTSPWDGVRNFEARNIMRDQMKLGDKVLFYHSNCKTPGVAGTATIVREGYPDYTAFDSSHPYYDAKSTDPSAPKWYMVDVKHESTFPKALTLTRMKQMAKLGDMVLIKRGGRLSVQPVRQVEYDYIVSVSG